MSYKYFLVEDDELARACIKKIINWQEQGFELGGEAPDGEEALEKITQDNSDIIFTDIRMPVMDGLELIERLREKYGSSKQIVLLTGYDEFAYAKFGLQHGVHDYLLKPVVAEELISCLTVFKEKARQRRLDRVAVTERLCKLCAQGDGELWRREVEAFFTQMAHIGYSLPDMAAACEFVLDGLRKSVTPEPSEPQPNWESAAELREHFIHQIDTTVVRHDAQEQDDIENIKRYIRLHYAEKLSLPVVAREFYMSPNYFSRMFKERAGENYKDYLTMVRIGYARELLEKTNYDMETISYAVGYANAKYFSNVFYKQMGIRPFEYRKDYREGKRP